MAKGSYLQVIINSSSTYTTEPIYQYDQCIYLQIVGLKNSKVTCHFAIAQSSVSVSQEPDSITNNECVIAIPNALTARSENIICYVYVENELSEFTITNWYLHDIDEENVTIRGVSPSGVSIMFARVTDETFAKDQKENTLLGNTLYITDTGKMYITDVNKSILQLGVVKEG